MTESKPMGRAKSRAACGAVDLDGEVFQTERGYRVDNEARFRGTTTYSYSTLTALRADWELMRDVDVDWAARYASLLDAVTQLRDRHAKIACDKTTVAGRAQYAAMTESELHDRFAVALTRILEVEP